MKVLLVHNRYREPGGEDAVFRAERALLEAGGHHVSSYERSNEEIDRYGPWRRATLALRTSWAWDTRRELAALLARERPEVAHFHNTFPLVSPAAYAACRAAGVPVVQTLHNYRLLCPAATLARAGGVCEECPEHSLLRSVQHACYRGSRLASAAVAGSLALHRRTGTWRRAVDVWVALSEFARAKLASAGLPEERIVVKPNFLARDPGPRQGDGDYALFVGRLAPEKGLRTLLEAWRQLPEPVPLRIAGDGPLRGELAARARELPGVELLGWQESARVLELLRNARFLALPSEWYEGFPMALVEAFACGVPVLASRLGSLAELVVDGVSGIHFAPGDPADLARAAARAWRDRGAARRLGEGARKAFEAAYTPARAHARLLEIYGLALRRRRGGDDAR